MNPKISIIIPVYNVEKYVEKCIKSVLNQTLKKIEVIIVDDGSNDKSMIKVKKIVNDDERVKIITQINQGVSIARNNGIKEAVGEYIGFVDSDDWINEDMYKTMYYTAVKCGYDIVACNHIIRSKNKNINRDYTPMLENKNVKSIMLRGVIDGTYPTLSCDKIYRRDLLVRNNINYEEGVNYLEDWYFVLKAIQYSDKIGFVCERFYNYRLVEGSLSHTYHKRYGDMILKLHKSKWIFMKENGLMINEFTVPAQVNLINDIFKVINYSIDNGVNNNEIQSFLRDSFIRTKLKDKISNRGAEELDVNINYYNINRLLISKGLVGVCIKFCKIYKRLKNN